MSETNGVTNKEEVKASNSTEISQLEEKIIQQMEVKFSLLYLLIIKMITSFYHFQYYFGDINLPRDKFLLEEMKHDDGCKF